MLRKIHKLGLRVKPFFEFLATPTARGGFRRVLRPPEGHARETNPSRATLSLRKGPGVLESKSRCLADGTPPLLRSRGDFGLRAEPARESPAEKMNRGWYPPLARQGKSRLRCGEHGLVGNAIFGATGSAKDCLHAGDQSRASYVVPCGRVQESLSRRVVVLQAVFLCQQSQEPSANQRSRGI